MNAELQPSETANVVISLLDVIRSRRTVRSYSPDEPPPSKAVLQTLLDAARWAPTPGNAQSWRFVVIQDESRIVELRNFSPGLLGKPPVVIVILSDTRVFRKRGIPNAEIDILAAEEAAMAAQNIILTTEALGLGSAVVGSFSKPAVQELLNCPQDVVPILLVAVGSVAFTPLAPKRAALSDISFYESFDKRKSNAKANRSS